MNLNSTNEPATALDARQQAIIPISAAAAAGDMARLGEAVNHGLDAGDAETGFHHMTRMRRREQ